MTISAIRCETPGCVKTLAKYGERYHRVHERGGEEGVDAQCEGCGGKHLVAGGWRHQCRACKADVRPGQLEGLFVPHLCHTCLDAARADQRSRGAVCRSCNRPHCDCCC